MTQPPLISAARQDLRVAAVLGLIHAVLVTILGQRATDPQRLCTAFSPDQLMTAGFRAESYGLVEYARDFVFATDPSTARVYNPLDVWLLDLGARWSGSLGEAFVWRMPVFAWAASTALYLVLRRVGCAPVAAGAVTALGAVQVALAWHTDGWGLWLPLASRAGFLVMPLMTLSLGAGLVGLAQDKPRVVLGAFALAGLSAWMHPVTGMHLMAALGVLSVASDVSRTGRIAWRATVMRIAAFLFGAIPTFVSLAHHPIYGAGGGAQSLAERDATRAALELVNPTWAQHAMPHPIHRLPWAKVLSPLLVLAVVVAAGAALAAVLWAWRGRATGRPVSDRTARWAWWAIALPGMAVVSITVLSAGATSIALICLTLLVVACGWGALVTSVRDRRPTPMEWLLVGTLAWMGLWTYGGSWAINAWLDYRHAPLPFFEQLRGVRVLWWTALVLAGLGVTQMTSRWPRVGGAFAAVALFVTGLHLYEGLAVTRTPLTHGEHHELAVHDWVRTSTPRGATIALLTGDPKTTARSAMCLKVRGERSMYYSYDAINLAFTRADALPEAKRRLQTLQALYAGTLPVGPWLAAEHVDYVVLPAGPAPSGTTQVYANADWMVVQEAHRQ